MEILSNTGCIHRLQFDVDWRPGHVACYLLDGPEPILVDAALPEHEDQFRDALAEHDYRPADIDHVLITHPHIDHIGVVPTLLSEGDPTLYAPVGARERFSQDGTAVRSRVRRNCIEAGFPEDRLDEATEMALDVFEENAERMPIDAVDHWIAPGDTTEIGGFEFDAVHVPGHQADHLCYPTEIDGESALLAGDMGIREFRPVAIHDGLDDGYREAIEAFLAAMDRLEALDIDTVYPGHGPVHDDLAGAIARNRESLNERVDGVEVLVGEGYSTAAGIASALAGEHGIKHLIPETMSSLVYLEKNGRITSELNGEVREYHP